MAGVFTFRTAHYGLAVRFLSTEQCYRESVTDVGHETQQFELTVTTPEMRANVLRSLLRHSIATRVDEPYELGWNNCMINLMVPLDHALKDDYPEHIRNRIFLPPGRIDREGGYNRESWFSPMAGPNYFKMRGLLESNASKLKNFENDPAFSPKTHAQKR